MSCLLERAVLPESLYKIRISTEKKELKNTAE